MYPDSSGTRISSCVRPPPPANPARHLTLTHLVMAAPSPAMTRKYGRCQGPLAYKQWLVACSPPQLAAVNVEQALSAADAMPDCPDARLRSARDRLRRGQALCTIGR